MIKVESYEQYKYVVGKKFYSFAYDEEEMPDNVFESVKEIQECPECIHDYVAENEQIYSYFEDDPDVDTISLDIVVFTIKPFKYFQKRCEYMLEESICEYVHGEFDTHEDYRLLENKLTEEVNKKILEDMDKAFIESCIKRTGEIPLTLYFYGCKDTIEYNFRTKEIKFIIEN